MEVIANQLGFDGFCLREPGEQFTMPEGSKGSWFDPVGAPRRGGKRGSAPPAVIPPDPPESDTVA